MQDDETIAVYNNQVEAYAKLVDLDNPGRILTDFIKRFNTRDLILDLGCGPANSSVHMKNAGLHVDPVDASSEMIKLANETYDIGARIATFDDLNEIDTYHGIWANFSLLHASREDMPRYLDNIHKALKPNGYFHIGMKLGENADRDKIGRFYTYYTEEELKMLLSEAGFTPIAQQTGKDKGLSGSVDPWITILSHTD